MVKLSRGTISRKTWKYCETHQTMILKKGPCAEAKCKGKGRERFELHVRRRRPREAARPWPGPVEGRG